jgi:hypothetical protein
VRAAASCCSVEWRAAADEDGQILLRGGAMTSQPIKRFNRELAAAGVSRASANYAIFDPTRSGQRLVGRVMGEGFRTN